MRNNRKSILMIEDDPWVSDWVDDIVEKEFKNSYSLELIRSEREFLIKLPSVEACAPSAIVLDLILPWEDGVPCESTEHLEPRGDIYDAGIRILEDFRNSVRLKGIPVLLYTVNDRDRIVFPASLKRPDILQKGDPDHLLIKWLDRRMSEQS